MAVSLDAWKVELELAGYGLGWTDVTSDVIAADRVKWRRGIMGSGPLDRVATPGSLKFSLNNSERNSSSTIGYYSPGASSCRSGFDLGIRVRVRLSYASSYRTVFIGRVEEITPTAGRYRDRRVVCTAYDWLEEAALFKITGIGTQTSQRADQVISTILATMPLQPESTSFDTGRSTFAYALDTARDESSFALGEFQKLVMSEAGQLFVKGDGSLVFENRTSRPARTTVSATLSNTMTDLAVNRRRDLVLNRVQATVHPRRVDTSYVTLFTLRTITQVRAGETVSLFGGYVDPLQLASRVGGTDMQTPVATTDYTFNAASDGSSTDLTSSLSVTMSAGFSAGGNGFYATIQNTGSADGYITAFRVRGKGIYDYENAVMVAQNTASQATYGINVLGVDMPYQNDPSTGSSVASYFVALYGATSRTYATSVSFAANRDNAHMLAALDCDISSRIALDETVTGLSSSGTQAFFINGVEGDLGARGVLSVKWTLAPADVERVWILGTSALGVDTRLGY